MRSGMKTGVIAVLIYLMIFLFNFIFVPKIPSDVLMWVVTAPVYFLLGVFGVVVNTGVYFIIGILFYFMLGILIDYIGRGLLLLAEKVPGHPFREIFK